MKIGVFAISVQLYLTLKLENIEGEAGERGRRECAVLKQVQVHTTAVVALQEPSDVWKFHKAQLKQTTAFFSLLSIFYYTTFDIWPSSRISLHKQVKKKEFSFGVHNEIHVW